MAKALTKVFQAVLIIGIIFGIALAINPSLYRSPALWIIGVLGILGNTLQPAYSPFKGGGPEDRGTMLHIVWTIYIFQALAMMEYAWKATSFDLTLYQYLFLTLSVFGLAFRTWAVRTLGHYFSMQVKLQKDHQLIATGPYRNLRHPSYTGAFLIYFCNTLFLEAYCVAVVFLPFLFWALHRRIKFEERCLREQFGAAYEDFCAKRYKLFPMLY